MRSHSSQVPWQIALLAAPCGLFVACGLFIACGLTPSHAPLGGDYRAPEVASAAPQKPPAPSSAANDDAPTPDDAPQKPTAVVAAQANVDAGVAPDAADTLRYAPLKTGDQIRADVSFSVSAAVEGGPTELRGHDSQMRLEAKVKVDLKILKSSTQSLDELEVTLTPVSLHTEFGGQSSDSTQDPTQSFDITLAGQTPNIRSKDGTPVEKEARAMLTVLVTPLIEFHNHWAHAPTLSLKPGWSSKVPIAAPPFMASPGDNLKVGPLQVRYDGREGSARNAAFALGLPVEWSSDIGKVSVDFNGRAALAVDKGRPLSLELNGPLTGNAGPAGAQIGVRGSAKFAAILSYP